MRNPNPDLLVLPFCARVAGRPRHLTFKQVMAILNHGQKRCLVIERSHPGAPEAIGWTVFRRRLRAYCYECEPLFRFERGARRYIRKAYAIEHALNTDDLLTYSHLHL